MSTSRIKKALFSMAVAGMVASPFANMTVNAEGVLQADGFKVTNEGNATVTFKDGIDGSQIQQVAVNVDRVVAFPVAPQHDGYNFKEWQLTSTTQNGSDNVYEITAVYQRVAVSYNHSAQIDRGTIENYTTNQDGTIVDFDVRPAAGYHVKTITANGNDITGTLNEGHIHAEIHENTTFVVTTEADTPVGNKYKVTTSIDQGTIDAGGEYDQSQSVTIHYAAAEGREIDTITVNGQGQFVSNPKQGSITLNYAGSDYNVVVTTKPATPAPAQHHMATSIDHGIITESFDFNDGVTVSVDYQPAAGYRVKEVLVNGVAVPDTNGHITFTNITQDMSVVVTTETVNPTPDPQVQTYAVSTSIDNGGIITPSVNVDEGSTKVVSFKAAAGYHIESVEVDGVSQSATGNEGSVTFENITGNHNVVVHTEKDNEIQQKFQIETSVTNGVISESQYEIEQGTTLVVRFRANTGYQIGQVLVDGSPVDITGTSGYVTFNNISSNHVVSVVNVPSTENNQVRPEERKETVTITDDSSQIGKAANAHIVVSDTKTGLADNSLPYILAGTAALVATGVFVVLRAKRKNEDSEVEVEKLDNEDNE